MKPTCWPQADFRVWNLSTSPLLKAYRVSISHCRSVLLSDSSTGCMSCGTETVSWHKVRLSFPHTVKESVLGQLTSSPKLKTPSPRSPASPNVKALSCCSDTTKWHSQSHPSPVWPYKTHVTKYRNHYQNGSSTTPQYKLPLQKCYNSGYTRNHGDMNFVEIPFI